MIVFVNWCYCLFLRNLLVFYVLLFLLLWRRGQSLATISSTSPCLLLSLSFTEVSFLMTFLELFYSIFFSLPPLSVCACICVVYTCVFVWLVPRFLYFSQFHRVLFLPRDHSIAFLFFLCLLKHIYLLQDFLYKLLLTD